VEIFTFPACPYISQTTPAGDLHKKMTRHSLSAGELRSISYSRHLYLKFATRQTFKNFKMVLSKITIKYELLSIYQEGIEVKISMGDRESGSRNARNHYLRFF
jgi:hypothetical protein